MTAEGSAVNFSLFGVETPEERYSWIGWVAFVLLTSLIGDTTILVASIKYNAFKLHDCVVVFIQHIAAGDLLVSLSCQLSHIIYLLEKHWVFGTSFCRVKAYVCPIGWIASSFFICLMSLFKLLLLTYPQRMRLCNRQQAHKLCTFIWAISVPSAYLAYFYIKNYVDFDFSMCDEIYFSCSRTKRQTMNLLFRQSVILLFPMAMVIFIIIVAVLLLKYLLQARKLARQSGKSARWQGIATVLLTALCHCFSYLLIIIREIAGPHMTKTYGLQNYAYIARATYTLLYFNVVANIFIYSFTVPSFRMFLKMRIERLRNLLPWSSSRNPLSSNEQRRGQESSRDNEHSARTNSRKTTPQQS